MDLFLHIPHLRYQRNPPGDNVVRPGLRNLLSRPMHVFRKGQRLHVQLGTSALELGSDILGQEFRVGTGSIHIQVAMAEIAVQGPEVLQQLHFIQKEIEPSVVDQGSDIFPEHLGVDKISGPLVPDPYRLPIRECVEPVDILVGVKGETDDPLFRNPFCNKKAVEELVQKI